jgi:hypothetical protein
MKLGLRVRTIHGWALAAALLAACGDDGSTPDSGICGTSDKPGVLKLGGLTPATHASVVNQSIVHSFTVVDAPADYHTFDLFYGDGHTAGASTPENPRFTTTPGKGSNIEYQMTIDHWSSAPGHVVLTVHGSFTTSHGCTWQFPSPLFEYDITPAAAPDGGAAVDGGKAADGGHAIDTAVDAPSSPDGPILIDLSPEVPAPVDTGVDVPSALLDASGSLDTL